MPDDAPILTLPESINLKDHPRLDEPWLQQRLAENPELLGLGSNLTVRERERRQPSGGRLDLLLDDPDSDRRYTVEIQLGALDESHIIRTIEYWDIERRRYPQYEHIAVIVAEDITGRFLNVISLFNGQIPLIAIQLRGVQVGDLFTLVATRVLDVVKLGTEEDDEPAAKADRGYWEARASQPSLKVVDGIVALVNEALEEKPASGFSANWNKAYIGLSGGGKSHTFVTARATKAPSAVGRFRVVQHESVSEELEDSGLDLMPYKRGMYRIRLRKDDLTKHRDRLKQLIQRAYEQKRGA